MTIDERPPNLTADWECSSWGNNTKTPTRYTRRLQSITMHIELDPVMQWVAKVGLHTSVAWDTPLEASKVAERIALLVLKSDVHALEKEHGGSILSEAATEFRRSNEAWNTNL